MIILIMYERKSPESRGGKKKYMTVEEKHWCSPEKKTHTTLTVRMIPLA